jgi:hypothetical protein
VGEKRTAEGEVVMNGWIGGFELCIAWFVLIARIEEVEYAFHLLDAFNHRHVMS